MSLKNTLIIVAKINPILFSIPGGEIGFAGKIVTLRHKYLLTWTRSLISTKLKFGINYVKKS